MTRPPLSCYQSPGVDGEPVLTVDVRPGEEGEVRLEVVARPHVLDGVQDLRRVGGGLLLHRKKWYIQLLIDFLLSVREFPTKQDPLL